MQKKLGLFKKLLTTGLNLSVKYGEGSFLPVVIFANDDFDGVWWYPHATIGEKVVIKCGDIRAVHPFAEPDPEVARLQHMVSPRDVSTMQTEMAKLEHHSSYKAHDKAQGRKQRRETARKLAQSEKRRIYWERRQVCASAVLLTRPPL